MAEKALNLRSVLRPIYLFTKCIGFTDFYVENGMLKFSQMSHAITTLLLSIICVCILYFYAITNQYINVSFSRLYLTVYCWCSTILLCYVALEYKIKQSKIMAIIQHLFKIEKELIKYGVNIEYKRMKMYSVACFMPTQIIILVGHFLTILASEEIKKSFSYYMMLWSMSFYTICVNSMVAGHFCTFLIIFYHMFGGIQKKLETSEGCSHPETAQCVRNLAKIHQELCDCVREFNEVYSISILLSITFEFINVTFTLYSILKVVVTLKFSLTLVTPIGMAMLGIKKIIIYILPSTYCINSVSCHALLSSYFYKCF